MQSLSDVQLKLGAHSLHSLIVSVFILRIAFSNEYHKRLEHRVRYFAPFLHGVSSTTAALRPITLCLSEPSKMSTVQRVARQEWFKLQFVYRVKKNIM